MKSYISLTAIGKDKPGIVSAITKVLFECKCNIEDSTMTILHGQFAMILIIKLAAGVTPKTLCAKLSKSSKSLGMNLSYTNLPSLPAKKQKDKNSYVISVYGADRTGIVYNVSAFLSKEKINITDVQTTVIKSGGKKTYVMLIETDFPKNLALDKVSKELAILSKSLNVAISVNRAERTAI